VLSKPLLRLAAAGRHAVAAVLLVAITATALAACGSAS